MIDDFAGHTGRLITRLYFRVDRRSLKRSPAKRLGASVAAVEPAEF